MMMMMMMVTMMMMMMMRISPIGQRLGCGRPLQGCKRCSGEDDDVDKY